MSPTVFRENAMSRTLNVAMPAALLLSALALSACATKPEAVPVSAPAPIVVVAEKPSAPEVAVEPAPAPVAVAEQPAVVAKPAPKQAVRKARKPVAKHTPPKAAPPEPVIAPAPIVVPTAPAVLPPEPSPPITIAPPPKIAEAGFLERYWLWLLGLVIAIAVIVVWGRKSQEDKA
jgi:hypothetical protein